jgi:hypothetical protein
VLERSLTGEVESVRPGRVDVTARDTDPDHIIASVFGSSETRVTEGTFEPQSLPGRALLALPGIGALLLFVDGGEPGTAAVGPPNAAGIAPTADYVQWLNLSPAFRLRGYFQSGNIQLTGVE